MPLKLIAIGVALLALAGLLAYGKHLQDKASRVDAAEARAEAAEQRAIDLSETYAKARAADAKDAQDLSDLRAQMGIQSLSFAQAIKAKPLTREVPRETINGTTEPCIQRDADRYFELYNQAVSGVASP